MHNYNTQIVCLFCNHFILSLLTQRKPFGLGKVLLYLFALIQQAHAGLLAGQVSGHTSSYRWKGVEGQSFDVCWTSDSSAHIRIKSL